jgi:hypothetical protein
MIPSIPLGNQIHSVTATIILLALGLFAAPAKAAGPATKPTTTPAIADAPEIARIRKQLIDFKLRIPPPSYADFRALFHTETERDATFCGFLAEFAGDEWRTRQAVRRTWGTAAETRFAHFYHTDSTGDDQECDIRLSGIRGEIVWKAKEIDPTPLIKSKGEWKIDGHLLAERAIEIGERAKKVDTDIFVSITIPPPEDKRLEMLPRDIDQGGFKNESAFFFFLNQSRSAPRD